MPNPSTHYNCINRTQSTLPINFLDIAKVCSDVYFFIFVSFIILVIYFHAIFANILCLFGILICLPIAIGQAFKAIILINPAARVKLSINLL